MRLLITGGCGFLGSNLTAEAIRRGWDVLVVDNLSRSGSDANRLWLASLGYFRFVQGDVRDYSAVESLVAQFRPEMIYHLAGQVAMTTSLANPRLDFETNAIGTVNVLESLRLRAPECGLIYSSTNKVYGSLEQFHYSETPLRYVCLDRPNGFDESTPFDCHSPYGCSKGTADMYVLDYARMYGLRSTVFRHSSMYGGRQYATVDQGWIGWFCDEALRIERREKDRVEIAGNGKQVRDVLHAQDMVSLYFATTDRMADATGHAFNIGGGMNNSLSLRELFRLIGELTGLDIPFLSSPPRVSDQRVFVADIKKAERLLRWHPAVHPREGVAEMLEWCRTRQAAP